MMIFIAISVFALSVANLVSGSHFRRIWAKVLVERQKDKECSWEYSKVAWIYKHFWLTGLYIWIDCRHVIAKQNLQKAYGRDALPNRFKAEWIGRQMEHA